MLQIASLWFGIGFPKEAVKKVGLVWGVGVDGTYGWMTLVKKVQMRRTEGVQLRDMDEVEESKQDVGRDWGSWNRSWG